MKMVDNGSVVGIVHQRNLRHSPIQVYGPIPKDLRSAREGDPPGSLEVYLREKG